MANTEVKARKNRSEAKPFYLASGTTSAEIVAEARTSVRCVDTKRPCTPVDSQRTLFGASRRPESHSRPPSAFRYNCMMFLIFLNIWFVYTKLAVFNLYYTRLYK